MDRFFELNETCYHTRGDRPWLVFPRTWIYERAERLDFTITGSLARYVTLSRQMIGRPCTWWRERGSKILDAPPKPNRA
jgi:hypothetical protein